MNIANYVDRVLNVLEKPLFDTSDVRSARYKLATEDDEVKDKLKVRTKNGGKTDDISEFLDGFKDSVINFLIESKKTIWGHTNLNPRGINLYDKYFVRDRTGKIGELCDLLNFNNEGNLNLFERQIVVLLGEKGAGKTITQNVWLHDHNKDLEDKKIFWVRLDVEKLYKRLWKHGKDINTKEYFLGQLLYVFCKRFKEIEDTITLGRFAPSDSRFVNSKLITEIYNLLSNSPDYNDIPFSDEKLTKNQLEFFKGTNSFIYESLKSKNYKKITEYLNDLEIVIAIDEGIYKNDGKTRLAFLPEKNEDFKKDKNYSFLIDRVFQDKKNQFEKWMHLAEKIRTFMLNKGYRILYMIDGIDNIDFDNKNDEDNYNKLLKQLLDFPLRKSGMILEKEQVFMAMRHNTFSELKKMYSGYNTTEYRDLEFPKKINVDEQEVIINEVFKKRINVINERENSNKWYGKTHIVEILDIIAEIGFKPKDLNRKWNFNYRNFIHSNINLAKYILFKYYWKGNDKKTLLSDKDKEMIKNDIKTFRDINLYLSGEMYACKEKMTGEEAKMTCFNIFDFAEGKYLLVYTYILMIIKALDAEYKQCHENIINIMCKLGFPVKENENDANENSCEFCIARLVNRGMLNKIFLLDKKSFAYKITKKGEFFLTQFYNSIDYLYYSCLDTKLPNEVFDSIKKYIAQNNFDSGEYTYFPPYSVITGICFLNYLISENKQKLKQIFNNADARKILSDNGIERTDLELPIKKDICYANDIESLRYSVSNMIRIFVKENVRNESEKKRNEIYREKLEVWLQEVTKASDDATTSSDVRTNKPLQKAEKETETILYE